MFQRGKLIRETEWMRVYESQPGTCYESKFLTDGLQVSAELIIRRWPSFSAAEKLEFANAFAAKPEVTPEDERILDFLMQAGDFYIWMAVALLLPCHRERERVLAFLLERIREDRKDTANFFQAIVLMKDKRAVPALRAAYDNYRKELRAGTETAVKFDYVEYLACCKALWEIDGSMEYKAAIEDFSRADDKSVRSFAEHLLQDE